MHDHEETFPFTKVFALAAHHLCSMGFTVQGPVQEMQAHYVS
jgi:hypothetical protein